MQHEILYLNENRVYVRVGNTWYDTNKNLEPKVGSPFLLGKIDEVLEFDQYTNLYPGSTCEIFESVNETVNREGYIRTRITQKLSKSQWKKIVKYGLVNKPKKDPNESNQTD